MKKLLPFIPFLLALLLWVCTGRSLGQENYAVTMSSDPRTPSHVCGDGVFVAHMDPRIPAAVYVYIIEKPGLVLQRMGSGYTCLSGCTEEQYRRSMPISVYKVRDFTGRWVYVHQDDVVGYIGPGCFTEDGKDWAVEKKKP